MLSMQHALPLAIRADRGVPFATRAIHGLSCLDQWWMRLGMSDQRMHAGQPQENGAHALTHRTMKRRALKPVRIWWESPSRYPQSHTAKHLKASNRLKIA